MVGCRQDGGGSLGSLLIFFTLSSGIKSVRVMLLLPDGTYMQLHFKTYALTKNDSI